MKFILFDIEATCWDGYHSNAIQEIIELGAISINRYGENSGTFDQLIRPIINPRLSHYCRSLTGISQEDVDAATVFAEVYRDFEDWSDGNEDTWFVSWGSFDKNILTAECERNFDDKSVIQNHLDLRSAYTSMKNLPPKTGLVKALEYEDKEFEGVQHRAFPDTENMMRIFLRYFDYWDIYSL